MTPPATNHEPKVGDRILYKLTSADVAAVTLRRGNPSGLFGGVAPLDGAIAGTPVVAFVTSVVPAVKATPTAPASPVFVNAQALLDGNDTLWVGHIAEGTAPGTWAVRSPA